MKISSEVKLDFDDVLLVPQRSKVASRKSVEIDKTYYFYHSPRKWNGIPIMAANMSTTGSFAMAEALAKSNMATCLHKHYEPNVIAQYFKDNVDKNMLQYVWYSMGMKPADFIALKKFANEIGEEPNICIDVANGYSEGFVDYCKMVRNDFRHSIIMAGNVATPEMVQELILHGGVDIVKVGIGPGMACTTRLKTGIGYPQLSAIDECAHAAHGLKSQDKHHGLVCGDGGCRQVGDVVKGFAVGGDFMMLGGMFAGADECEGEWEYSKINSKEFDHKRRKIINNLINELEQTLDDRDRERETLDKVGFMNFLEDYRPDMYKKYKKTAMDLEKEYSTKKNLLFYGMSSKKAQEKHGTGLQDYRSSEGRVLKVPCKGPVGLITQDILGGLRSGCTYTGATSLKDLPKTAKFVMVNRTHHDQSVE